VKTINNQNDAPTTGDVCGDIQAGARTRSDEMKWDLRDQNDQLRAVLSETEEQRDRLLAQLEALCVQLESAGMLIPPGVKAAIAFAKPPLFQTKAEQETGKLPPQTWVRIVCANGFAEGVR
jgi:hypothetical protein